MLDRDDDAPYDIRRTLAFGHSAAVEEVIDIHTGAVYARKVIWLHAGERARRQRIFEQEAEIIRNLACHHHIIRVFATYYAEPKVFLILQPVATSGNLEVFLRMYREKIGNCNNTVKSVTFTKPTRGRCDKPMVA